MYTSGKSGRKNKECHGWQEEGVELYNALVKEVKKRRSTPESILWEKQYMNKMKLDRATINESDLTSIANPPSTGSNNKFSDSDDSDSDKESVDDDTDARFKEAIHTTAN